MTSREKLGQVVGLMEALNEGFKSVPDACLYTGSAEEPPELTILYESDRDSV